MSEPSAANRYPILVEFATEAGVHAVALKRENLIERSEQAIESALDTIQQMACRLAGSVATLPDGPRRVEIEFGLRLRMEGQAFIAKVASESNVIVRLVWESAAAQVRPSGHPVRATGGEEPSA